MGRRWIPAAAAALICLVSTPPLSAATDGASRDGPAAIQAGGGAPPPVTVDGPSIALEGVPVELTLRAGQGTGPVAVRIVAASGRVLHVDTLVAGEERAVGDLALRGGQDLPLTVEAAGRRAGTVDPPLVPGWFSLLPPLLAILLALVFREVVISLFAGVWLGAFFYAGLDPLAATWRTVDRFVVPALADPDQASIVVFSFLLGGMVGVISRSGGTMGIVDAVRPLATSPRRAQAATFLAGLSVFFDDYANTLIVGNTMRPITDRLKVSREKLAYLVDSTAAPVAAIVFVSTWVGFEIGLIGDGLEIAARQTGTGAELAAQLLDANPFTVFIHSIPYLFYPILALVMVFLVIVTQRDFGPMWDAENRASRGEGLYREDAQLMSDTSSEEIQAKEGAPRRWYNAVLPVVTVIAVVLLGLYLQGRAITGPGASLWDVFGAASAFDALLWGSLSGCVVAIGLAVGQRILDPQESVDALLGGMKAMMLAAVILVLAWSLSAVTEALGTATYLSGVLSEGVPLQLVPVLTFLTAACIAFATGTSWGTMGILLPLVIPLVVAMGGGIDFDGGGHYSILLGSISSVLAGAIFGDHCSPISDTTVLSSMASGCDHVDHVRTQLPYAVTVALVGMAVGDIPTAYGFAPWISHLLGAGILFAVLWVLGRPDHASTQWSGGSPAD